MFLKPTRYDKSEKKIFFTKDICLDGESPAYAEFLCSIFSKLPRSGSGVPCGRISLKLGFPKRIKEIVGGECANDEAYAIEIGKETKIFAKCERALIYALTTLSQLSKDGELYAGFLYDEPVCRMRGYRVFLPKREGFEDFKRMVDFLSYYKYNAIMLEIGGAMQYERHPEINERWARFCKETHAYSGRTHEIQHKTYPWKKNSIHTDNAEGDILTKDECRELAEYCRSRGLEVIPECPTLSHCDYIVMAHPEIREREGDDYPDTYCPNHPDTYPLVFDVLDEVIEVFHPEKINIGHDEAYSISVCKRCKKIPAPQNYANDVNKICKYLKERGIKTMMWGEKLLNAHYKREPIGGAGYGKGLAKVNALYPCRDLISRDVIMLHWYYVFNPEYDKVYHTRNITMVFGNLSVLNLNDWDKRISLGAVGGFVSNWGSFGEEYMQRNCQYFDLISAAYAFWCKDFGSMTKEEQIWLTASELYRLKLEKTKNPLTVTHTTTYKTKFKYFFDGIFIVDDEYMLGSYRITYSDGTEATLPVKFGTNIGTYKYDDYKNETAFKEVIYSTLPKRYKEGFAYKAVYEDPHPDKKIVSLTFVPREDKKADVELISFTKNVRIDKIQDTKTHFAGEDFAWDGTTVDE